jgi:uncharacterized membrane protein YkvA (DUF1232 family)
VDVAAGATGLVPPVPGPPRGRRRPLGGDLAGRVRAMRAAELDRDPVRVLTFLRDVILLVKDLAVDPRVPRGDKLLAGLGVAYLVSPVDVLPGVLPVLGRLDDLGVAAFVVHRLLAAAGYEVIYQTWRGSDEGLALLLTLAGVQE